MAKLVLFSPYYKASENNMGGYARYLATRDGVQFPRNTKLDRHATNKQVALIEKMLYDFPNSRDLHEYEDYVKDPTILNASEFISRVLESNVEIVGMSGYLKYMGTRPGVDKTAEHGLFTDRGTPVYLSQVEEELNAYQGNIWTHIISLRREDAARLGYDNALVWQKLLTLYRNEIAKNMRINEKNFKWYAAFHNEGRHPHVHMMAYSTDINEAYLDKKGIRNIKSCLAKEIFKDDLSQIYQKQTEYRDELKADSKEITEQIIEELKQGNFNNENIKQLLFKLNDMLHHVKGKKVYGYLKPEVKAIANLIVDEIEKDDRIKRLYDLWYDEKDKIISTYTSERLKRIPLSQNKEFKSVRNMVIREALKLYDMIAIFDDEITDEPIYISAEDIEAMPDDDELDDEYFDLNSSQKYWKAKRLLDENSEEYDFITGFSLLKESANDGNEYAQYRLGRMLFEGETEDRNIQSGVYWLEQSVRQGNSFAEYFLGKQYLGNGNLNKNYKRAIHLLTESAAQGNKYAQYTLACQYLFSDEFPKKRKDGLSLLESSAEKRFAPAEKMLAFIILQGEMLPKDELQAFKLLQHSADQGDDKAQYAQAKLLLRSEVIPKDVDQAVKLLQSAIEKNNEWAKLLLGKMLLFGIDIPQDIPTALELLESAAEQGNEYAEQVLKNREDWLRTTMALSTMRLFGYVGKLIRRTTAERKLGMQIDKKQYSEIQEKKIAHGLRQ